MACARNGRILHGGSTGGKKAGWSSRIFLVPWEKGQRRQWQVVCYKAVVEAWALDLKERRESEELKLAYHLSQP